MTKDLNTDPRDTAWSQGQHSAGPWACYHCSFTAYTHEEAREHFGPDRWGLAACQAVTTHRERIERIIGDPKAASRVMFLLEAMARNDELAAAEQALSASQQEVEAWAWFAARTSLSLDWGEIDNDESECAWRVHRITGNRNDREWDLIGTGETALEAVQAARSALQAGGKEHG